MTPWRVRVVKKNGQVEYARVGDTDEIATFNTKAEAETAAARFARGFAALGIFADVQAVHE